MNLVAPVQIQLCENLAKKGPGLTLNAAYAWKHEKERKSPLADMSDRMLTTKPLLSVL